MHDAAQAFSKRYRTLVVEGEEYRLYDLSLADLGELQAWLDSLYREPLEVIAPQLGRFDLEVAKFLVRDARDAACRPRPQLGQGEANLLLLSVDGIKEVLYLAIRKGRPDFSRDDLDALCRRITLDDAYAAIEATGLMGGRDDPRAESPKSSRPANAGASSPPTRANPSTSAMSSTTSPATASAGGAAGPSTPSAP